jgi:membrane protease YdiL (CAAX protease family)
MTTEAMKVRSSPIINTRYMVLQTLAVTCLALAIMAIFGKQPLLGVFLQGKPWPVQVALGIPFGLLMTGPLVVLINRVPGFDAFRRQVAEFVSRADLSGLNPLWFSLCAGVAEEMLFRGALQPLVGLWLTCLIFTALHYQTGGFRTMNRMKAVYAVLVFLASFLLGTICLQVGLIAAVVTHTVGDLVALTMLRTVRT